MNAEQVLRRLLDVAVTEMRSNPHFAEQIAAVFQGNVPSRSSLTSRPTRRSPGPFDPFQIHREHGSDRLRQMLATLSVEQLKDIVAEHGMDRSKLAMKWKTSDRFIPLIVELVETRSRKGDAFRTPKSPKSGALQRQAGAGPVGESA